MKHIKMNSPQEGKKRLRIVENVNQDNMFSFAESDKKYDPKML